MNEKHHDPFVEPDGASNVPEGRTEQREQSIGDGDRVRIKGQEWMVLNVDPAAGFMTVMGASEGNHGESFTAKMDDPDLEMVQKGTPEDAVSFVTAYLNPETASEADHDDESSHEPEALTSEQATERVRGLQPGDIVRTRDGQNLTLVRRDGDALYFGDSVYFEKTERGEKSSLLQYDGDEIARDVVSGEKSFGGHRELPTDTAPEEQPPVADIETGQTEEKEPRQYETHDMAEHDALLQEELSRAHSFRDITQALQHRVSTIGDVAVTAADGDLHSVADMFDMVQQCESYSTDHPEAGSDDPFLATLLEQVTPALGLREAVRRSIEYTRRPSEKEHEVVFAPEKESDKKLETRTTTESASVATQGVETEPVSTSSDTDTELPDTAPIPESEVHEAIKAMPEREQRSFLEGLTNIGYAVQLGKSKFFKSIFEGLAGGKEKAQDVSRLATGSSLQRLLAGYADVYRHDEDRASKALHTKGKSKKSQAMGVAQGLGVALRYGRILYDVGYANPLRHITAAATFVGKNAEAVKEARFKSAEALDATRVVQVEQALDEALELYSKAQGESGVATKEDLDRAYRELLPSDLMKRIKRPLEKVFVAREETVHDDVIDMQALPSKAEEFGFFEHYARKRIEKTTSKIQKQLDAVDAQSGLSDTERASQKQNILTKYERFLRDADRIVGDMGTIDTIGYVSKRVEQAGKTVATAMTIETGAELLYGAVNLFNAAEHVESDHDIGETKDSVPHAPGQPAVHPEGGARPLVEKTSLQESILKPYSRGQIKHDSDALLRESALEEASVSDSPTHETPLQEPVAESSSEALPTTEVPTSPEKVSEAVVESPDHEVEQAPVPEVVSSLTVQIHEGEGMIKAFSRTLVEQYQVPEAQASAIAEQVYAHDTDKMPDLVHTGDRFEITFGKAITPDDLRLGVPAAIAENADYNPETLATEAPHLPETVERLEPEVLTGVDPEKADAYVQVNEGISHVVIKDEATEKYLTEHHVRFEPETRTLHFDLDNDGTVSNKEVVIDLDEHLKGYDRTEFFVDREGNLHVEAFDSSSNQKQLFTFSMEGEVMHRALESLIAEVPVNPPTVEAQEAVLSVEGRIAEKLAKRITEAEKTLAQLDAKHSGILKRIKELSALDAAESRKEFSHILQTTCGLNRSEAHDVAKPLHYVFERIEKGFRVGGAPLGAKDTIGAVLKRLDLKLTK